MLSLDVFVELELADRAEGEPQLVVDLGGFEGPLDLLLDLARRQKVDLAAISILALADQYLAFIEQARQVRIELAADYLVMAAWLAYLKSRLYLPDPPSADESSAADLAGALALRLKRLERMRAAARQLMDRPRLGREMFGRGAPEPVAAANAPAWEASLYDLLSAYARQRQKQALSRVTVRRRVVWSLAEARAALARLIGAAGDWTEVDAYLLDYAVDPAMRGTVRASSFAAMLELAREGALELRQDRPFSPLFARRRAQAQAAGASA